MMNNPSDNEHISKLYAALSSLEEHVKQIIGGYSVNSSSNRVEVPSLKLSFKLSDRYSRSLIDESDQATIALGNYLCTKGRADSSIRELLKDIDRLYRDERKDIVFKATFSFEEVLRKMFSGSSVSIVGTDYNKGVRKWVISTKKDKTEVLLPVYPIREGSMDDDLLLVTFATHLYSVGVGSKVAKGKKQLKELYTTLSGFIKNIEELMAKTGEYIKLLKEYGFIHES